MKNLKSNTSLVLLLLAGFVLRLLISPHFTHFSDMGLWHYWGDSIYDLGFHNFFTKVSWTDYLPLYFYFLFTLEWIGRTFNLSSDLLFKMPSIISDLIAAVVIYKLVNLLEITHSKYKNLPLIAAGIYLLNPAIFANSAMWGQVDGLGALLVLLTILFFVTQKPILLGIFLACALLFKPLYLISLPLILIAQLKIDYKKLPALFSGLVLTSVVLTFPFTQNILNTIPLIAARYSSSLGQYHYASVNAFNFWGSLGKNFASDETIFANLTLHSWGLFLFVLIFGLLFLKVLLSKTTEKKEFFFNLTESLTLGYLAITMFATRVHERHLLTAIALMTLFIFRSKLYLFSFLILSAVYLVNLYFGYKYLILNGGFVFGTQTVGLLSLTAVVVTLILLLNYLKDLPGKIFKFNVPNLKLSPKKILLIILVIAALTRLVRLDYPNAYVFDEVYHGFTAKEYLKGSKEAWEYWTSPPPGVAFEWTHPPLAKELMTVSMFLVKSTDAWAWRLPGALLGILSIYLIYLISKQLFKNEKIALLSAGVYSLEGLLFVQSRTGMNDIYLVTFLLTSLLFFLKEKRILSAIFLGLALASKWTAIYFIGFYALFYLFNFILDLTSKNREGSKADLFINHLLKALPFLVILIVTLPALYFISYIPFFLLGHDYTQFTALQQQMWWYHINLKANHDYASAWWTWPFNLYPVWYYVQYHQNNWLSNIFASGNPIVFWLGFGAILTTLYDFIKLRSKSLLVILLGYLIFWLPWALSPRIMFLYHYSPSIPFLSLALGYQLSQFDNSPNGRKILLVLLTLILIGFLIVYPLLTGLPLPKDLMLQFFKINSTKNPFG